MQVEVENSLEKLEYEKKWSGRSRWKVTEQYVGDMAKAKLRHAVESSGVV